MHADETQIEEPLNALRRVTGEMIGGFSNVYNQLGFGFPESVCSNALAVELGYRGLRFGREVPLEVVYRGVVVGFFRVDFLVEEQVIVETKASRELLPGDEHQLLNYLHASRFEIGLLLHFGPKACFKRYAYSNSRK